MMKTPIISKKPSVTRGYGLLEKFLSQQRCKMANRLIIPAYRQGQMLDIGCGVYPLFLKTTQFAQKFGLDKTAEPHQHPQLAEEGIVLSQFDFEEQEKLPFQNDCFDIITMLAVFEHIFPQRLVVLLTEIYRILKPNGMLIITTPAALSDAILSFMALTRLVSPTEICDHKKTYYHEEIIDFLQKAGFAQENICSGYFEMFLNTWVTAKK